MKVLKFGGTSVGSAASLKNVKKIALSQDDDTIIVASALGGITDCLLRTSAKAAAGDAHWEEDFRAIEKRHVDLCGELGVNCTLRVKELLSDLHNLYLGVYLLRALSPKTTAEIVSFGERMSNLIIADYIGIRLYDSLEFIRTFRKGDTNVLDPEVTDSLIKKTFKDFKGLALAPGFISRDTASGEITNLGRGGSDYTAAIIAGSLDAVTLEIWTDVDGFMTADPRIIQTSYVIDELSYDEAMELCNFGAKVIYPPALYPVCAKNIPIYVKNTFNPECKGTIIVQKCSRKHKNITGISSVDNTCLLTLSGTSMVDIVGVDRRIFTCLAKENISVFFISQASSETGITLGLKSEVAERAKILIDDEFIHEISVGAISPVKIDKGLATVAVVGESMKETPGVAGKLFTTLGRSGISVISIAQGTTEINISFVIESSQLKKALNVIHDSFFLSEFQELNLFICGIGTVGGQLIGQICAQREKLMRERGLKLNIVCIARSTKALFDRNGIDLQNWRERLDKEGVAITPSTLRDTITEMNLFNPVFVDCTASESIAALYNDFFDASVSVVTANKIAASSEYSNYIKLKENARNHGVKFLFETNVGAGLPIINTINDLVNSGDRIERIEAVLSGTLNFIFNTLSEDIPFSQTVRMAKEQGFSEPDPRLDLCGKDVVRKLVILSREAGYKLNQEDVKASLFIPEELFKCSMDDFWKALPELDADFEARRKELAANHMRWRFVAKLENGEFSVSLKEIGEHDPLYDLDGSNNIVLLTTERYHQYPMLIQGYGAGAGVTAAGVFADIMRVANI